MYRVAIIFKNGTISSGLNFNTKGEAEDYILKESEKQDIKRADLKNLETGERERAF